MPLRTLLNLAKKENQNMKVAPVPNLSENVTGEKKVLPETQGGYEQKPGNKYDLPVPISYLDSIGMIQLICLCLYFPLGCILMVVRSVLMMAVFWMVLLISIFRGSAVESFAKSTAFCRILMLGLASVGFDDRAVQNKEQLFKEKKNAILTNHHMTYDMGLVWHILYKELGVKCKVFANKKVAKTFPYSIFKSLLVVSKGRQFVELFNHWSQDGADNGREPILLAGSGMSTHRGFHAQQAHFYFMQPVQVTPVHISFENPFGVHNRHVSSSMATDLLVLFFLPWTTARLTVLDPLPVKVRNVSEAKACAWEATMRMCRVTKPPLKLTAWSNHQKRTLERYRKGDTTQLHKLELSNKGVMKAQDRILLGQQAVTARTARSWSHSHSSMEAQGPVHVVCDVENVLLKQNGMKNTALLNCLQSGLEKDKNNMHITLISDQQEDIILRMLEMEEYSASVMPYFDVARFTSATHRDKRLLLIRRKLPSEDEEKQLEELHFQYVLINPSKQDRMIGVAWQIPMCKW